MEAIIIQSLDREIGVRNGEQKQLHVDGRL